MTDWVQIYHPDLDLTATVARSSVKTHAGAGWREVHSELEAPDSVPDSYNPDPIPDEDSTEQKEL